MFRQTISIQETTFTFNFMTVSERLVNRQPPIAVDDDLRVVDHDTIRNHVALIGDMINRGHDYVIAVAQADVFTPILLAAMGATSFHGVITLNNVDIGDFFLMAEIPMSLQYRLGSTAANEVYLLFLLR